MSLTNRHRGERFCPRCGCELKWIRLLSGSWIAVEPEPIYYEPRAGRSWLVEGRKWDAEILKDCKIWRRGMPTEGLKKGYKPHAWECEG